MRKDNSIRKGKQWKEMEREGKQWIVEDSKTKERKGKRKRKDKTQGLSERKLKSQTNMIFVLEVFFEQQQNNILVFNDFSNSVDAADEMKTKTYESEWMLTTIVIDLVIAIH